MKTVEWKTYRTRFLVKAKQLNSSLSFTDHLGRQHCGRRGDYLVESCDGVLSIAPRQIFEDIYVAMTSPGPSPQPSSKDEQTTPAGRDDLRLSSLRVEPLQIEKIKTNFRSTYGAIPFDKTARPQRKIPQPVRVSSSRLGLM